MACSEKQMKLRKDINYIRRMATIYSNLNKADVQIFKVNFAGVGEIYNYEPVNLLRENIIETIKYKS